MEEDIIFYHNKELDINNMKNFLEFINYACEEPPEKNRCQCLACYKYRITTTKIFKKTSNKSIELTS